MLKKGITIIIMLLLFTTPITLLTGCEDNNIPPDHAQAGEGDEAASELAEAENILAQAKELYEKLKTDINDALLSTPRVVHDRNLSTIDRAVELYQLMERKDPSGIGTQDEPGTLVGEGYLDAAPVIPSGLQEEVGEWSQYTLKGKPLRTWPIGDWGGYRDGDTP